MKLKHQVYFEFFLYQTTASSYNVNYIEASAKGNIKVEETFIAITRQII